MLLAACPRQGQRLVPAIAFALVGLAASVAPSGAGTDGLRLNEVGLACANGDSAIQFVELVASQTGQTFQSSVGLQVRDRSGAVIMDRANLFPTRGNGFAWSNGRTWLIATVAFEGVTSGLLPDLEAPLALDPAGGTLTLYDSAGGYHVLHEFSYGLAGGVAVPAAGHSLQRQSDGSMAEKSPPDPRTFAGRTTSTFACPAPGLRDVRIRELALACLNEQGSDPSIQFLELAATGTDGSFQGSAGIEIQDAAGNIVYEQTGLFASQPDGTGWPTGKAWLIATLDFESGAGLHPDVVIPAVFDPDGGTIAFFDTTGGARTIIHSVSYGTAGAPAAPAPGRSLELQSDGSFAPSVVASPTNFSGASKQGFGCACTDPTCLRVNEFATSCENYSGGDSSAQFIELTTARSGQAFRSSVGIRIKDLDGTVRFDQIGLFAGQTDGAAFPVGRSWLIATEAARAATGLTADLVVPAALTRAGGSIDLYDTSDGRTRVFLHVPYGRAGQPAPPGPGRSLQLQLDGRFLERAPAVPGNFAGLSSPSFGCQCLSTACVRIDELALACFDYFLGDTSVQFIELAALQPNQRFSASMGLRVRDRFGTVRFDRVGLFTPRPDGDPWPEGRTWLLATPGFQAHTGVPPDLVMSFGLDPVGGTLTLYDTATQPAAIIEDFAYGTAGGPAVPAPGRSLDISLTNGVHEKSIPDPTNFAGQSATSLVCPCPSPACVRVNELGLACTSCAGNDPAVQYIELVSIQPGQRLDSRLGLRVSDRRGGVIFDLQGPLSTIPAGTPWPVGKTLLLATAAFQANMGLAPDALLPAALDSQGGKITLYVSDPSGPVTVSEVSYSFMGAPPAPPAGWSLKRISEHNYNIDLPDPTNFAGESRTTFACICAALAGLRIAQVGMACTDGSTQTQFVELEARAPSQKFLVAGLRIQDRNGVVTMDNRNLYPSQTPGAPWPEGSPWLVAKPGETLVTGITPDLSIASLALDPVGGTLTLYDGTAPALPVLHQFSYGSAGGVPAPAPGHSLQIQPDGSMAEKSDPDPQNFAGQTAPVDCSKLLCPCPGVDGIRIDELMTVCEGGDSTVQFLTLRAIDPGQMFQSSFGIEVRDHSGTLTLAAENFLRPAGSTWPAGKPWLIATDVFRATTDLYPDVLVGLIFDRRGGMIKLYDSSYGVRRVIQTLSYGAAGGPPAPAPGHSLARQADGSYAERVLPQPANFAGQTPISMSCDCPLSSTNLLGLTRIPVRDTSIYYPYFRSGHHIAYDLRLGSMTSQAQSNWYEFGAGTVVNAADEFTVSGLEPGTPVAFTGRFRAQGSGGGNGGLSATAGIAGNAATILPEPGTSFISFDTTLTIPIQVLAGQDFMLSYYVSNGVVVGGVSSYGQLSFSGLPPGARVTSCQGFPGDIPVPVTLALANASASADLARLDWFAADAAGLTGRVERRTAETDWAPAGTVVGDGTGHLVFEDRAVVGGARYGYRLSVTREGATVTTPETWLEIPRVARFALHAVRPNPARGAFTIAFELPDGAPASLDVLDVSGRRVGSWAVGSMGVGAHEITPGGHGPLPAGIYVVRLTRGGRSLATKACVIW